MLRAGDELIVVTGLEAEKRTDVRSKNLCKSKNYIQFCNVCWEIIVIFLELLLAIGVKIRVEAVKSANLVIFQEIMLRFVTPGYRPARTNRSRRDMFLQYVRNIGVRKVPCV